MSVRIRMKRTGTTNLPCYRVVVADARAQRDGRSIEQIGFYDPKHHDERLDLVRYDYWVKCGAEASETVQNLARRVRDPEADAKRRGENQRRAKEKAAAAARKPAADAAAAPAAEAQA